MSVGDVIKTKANGKVRWFSNSLGFGFGVEDGASTDIFIHFSSISGEQDEGTTDFRECTKDQYRLLNAGESIIFDIIESDRPGKEGETRYAAKNVIRIVPKKKGDATQ